MEIFRKILYNGERVLQDSEIKSLFSTILEDYNYEDLECLPYDDLPQIRVTRIIQKDGADIPIVKSIS